MGSLSIELPTTLFSISPSQRSTNPVLVVGWLGPNATGTDADIIEGLTNGGSIYCQGPDVNQDLRIKFRWSDLTEAVYVLDGGAPISFNDLPSGFMMKATLKASISIGSSVVPTITASLYRTISGVNTTVQPDIYTFDELLSPGLEISGDAYISGAQFEGAAFDVFVEDVFSPGPFTPPFLVAEVFQLQDYEITGVYGIFVHSWTIDTPGPVGSGQTIHISGNNLGNVTACAILLDNGSSLTATIADQSDTDIDIVLPDMGTYTGVINVVPTVTNPNPTEFSGSVNAGTLDVLLASASGIYSIVPGKRNDTVYDFAGDTLDVKIPNPFIKTGFIGG